jgi:hypothetical protein
MRRIALIVALMAGGVVSASDASWQPMTGAEIRAALEGRVLIYDSGAWQEFRASGRTLYNAGNDSWGYWNTRGDQYCSQWPPQGQWECYAIQRNKDRLRFVGPSGDVTEGEYSE